MRWQLPCTWLVGSSVTGTIAILFTTDRGAQPFRSLAELFEDGVWPTLVVLVGALFLALFALAWRTRDAMWLRRDDPRSALLWPILVGGGGLVGWGFAAVVTFEADFSLATQLVLAYTCGGLPFTLVAAMLARPWRLNVVAAVLTAIAVLVGLVMLDGPVLPILNVYLSMLLAPVTPL
jgi:hypothetical protein